MNGVAAAVAPRSGSGKAVAAGAGASGGKAVAKRLQQELMQLMVRAFSQLALASTTLSATTPTRLPPLRPPSPDEWLQGCDCVSEWG
jgi:hypothetical protein